MICSTCLRADINCTGVIVLASVLSVILFGLDIRINSLREGSFISVSSKAKILPLFWKLLV